MTNQEIQKELYFVKRVLDSIYKVEVPKIVYEEEKQVVAKALRDYESKLQDKLYGY